MSPSWSKRALAAAATAASLIAPAVAFQKDVEDRVLLPAVHWGLDRESFDHLKPAVSGPQYFASSEGLQSEFEEHAFGNLEATYTRPTVVLEHSKYISNVTCNNNGMAIFIEHDKAFQEAEEAWAAAPNQEIGLVSHVPGCGSSRRDARSYWHSNRYSFMKQKKGGVIVVAAKEVTLKQSLRKAKIQFGAYKPATQMSRIMEKPKRCIIDCTHTYSTENSFTINIAPTNNANSPWGAAYDIFEIGGTGDGSPPGGNPTPTPTPAAKRDITERSLSLPEKRDDTYIDAYCVGCGASGSFTIEGELEFDVVHPTEASASITFSGNLDATLQIGLVGNEAVSHSFSQDIATAGLPGFSVPDVFTIGPELTLSAEVDLTLHAAGQIIAGATLSVPPFQSTFQLFGSNNPSQSNFNPSLTATPFQASGQVGLTVGFGLPVSVGLGLDIPAIDFNKNFALVDTPSINVDGTYNGDGCSGGIATTVNFEDKLDLDILGLDTISIADWTSPSVLSQCISL